jgi:hypothetical protein
MYHASGNKDAETFCFCASKVPTKMSEGIAEAHGLSTGKKTSISSWVLLKVACY